MSLFSGDYAKKVLDAARASATDMVVNDLVVKKRSSSGYIDRKTMDKAWSGLQSVGITISKNSLSQKVARKLREDNNAPPTKKKKTVEPSPEEDEEEELATPIPPDPSESLAARVFVVAGEEATAISTIGSGSPVEEMQRPKGGRPKGTTNESKRQAEFSYKHCLDAIELEYSTEFAAARSKKKRMPKGWLDNLIEEKRKEYGVKNSISKDN